MQARIPDERTNSFWSVAPLGNLQGRIGLDTTSFGPKLGSFTRVLEMRAKG